jgi:uncharacterized protein (TIGR02996 family)
VVAKRPTKGYPIAPDPAATLVGPPALPRSPAKSKPPPIPKPALKKKLPPADPVVLRAALDAVLAAPDSDPPRVTYAGILTASGDARGEFIRAGLRGEVPNANRWTKPLRALGKSTRWRWNRGFVHELRINGYDAECTPTNLAAVLATEPVIELALEGCDPDQLARILALPGLERIKRLAVSGWDATEGGAYVGRVLAKAKRLTGVTELRAGIKLGDAGLASLCDTEALGACVHLAFGAADASIEAVAAIASSPLGQRLETFEWLRDQLSDDMTKVIMTMPSLRGFVASTGYVDAHRKTFRDRFRDRFVVESEPGTQYLLDGVRGVSYRPPPKR